MTVDQWPTAKWLEQSNRHLVQSGIADAHRFDSENFRFIKIQTFQFKDLRRQFCYKCIQLFIILVLSRFDTLGPC
jgi:hypothetical protein